MASDLPESCEVVIKRSDQPYQDIYCEQPAPLRERLDDMAICPQHSEERRETRLQRRIGDLR
jgi:hypothetical protein